MFPTIYVRRLMPLIVFALVATLAACSSDDDTAATVQALGPTATTRAASSSAKSDDEPAATAQSLRPTATARAASTSPKQYSAPPPMTIDPDKTYTATIVMEDGGEIVIDLFAKDAPMTVNNFVFLARDGFFDGITFHRVIAGFMSQSGDPTGTGRGGPGYRFNDELSPKLRHSGPGTLSMANSGKNTNGSQFFITHVATPHLDGIHSVFGQVTQGLDVALGFPEMDPAKARTKGAVIKTITITESG